MKTKISHLGRSSVSCGNDASVNNAYRYYKC